MSSRNKTFAQFLSRYQAMAGIETMTDTITDRATQYFAKNARFAWEFYAWPWSVHIEERSPDADNLIEYAQAGETVIADVYACFRYDPFGTQGQVPVAYQLTSEGIQFYENAVYDPTFVYFREQAPDYYGEDYSAGTAYAVGDQVYYPTTGDFYRCIQAGTGNAPTLTAFWTRLTVPWDIFEYCVMASYADTFLANGQLGSAEQVSAAASLRDGAMDLLYTAVEVYDRQQSYKNLRKYVFTHGTQQLRN